MEKYVPLIFTIYKTINIKVKPKLIINGKKD